MFINWDIVKHPMNWVVLFLMVFIAALALHLVSKNLPSLSSK